MQMGNRYNVLGHEHIYDEIAQGTNMKVGKQPQSANDSLLFSGYHHKVALNRDVSLQNVKRFLASS